jgi:toxin-antitoxin system PIN domain toxin
VIHLLDVNVLVALFDPSHVHHDAAHRWFQVERVRGWATCPLTENGVVRVLSNPTYPGRRTTVADAVSRLTRFTASGRHRFWPADASLLGDRVIAASRISGYRQITDVYLLALAVRHGGRLATFDRGIPVVAVPEAGPEQIAVLPVGR